MGVEQEQVQQEPESVDVDIDALGEDELDALELDEDGKPAVKPEPDTDQEKVDKESDSEQGKDEPKEGEGEKATEAADGKEETQEGEESEPEEVSPEQKRIKDLQSGFTKERQRAIELENKLREMEAKLKEKELKQFETLSDEEELELAETDPEAFRNYLLQKVENEKREAELAKEKEVIRDTQQNNEVVAFMQNTFSVAVDPYKPIEEQAEEVRSLSDKMQAISKYAFKNYKPNADGVYTSKQLADAYKALYFEDIVAEERKKAMSTTVDSIERASKGGSVLDRASKSGGGNKPKSVFDVSPDDIDAMSEDELDSLMD